MVVVCPVCREVVHLSNGYILLHGTTYHDKFIQCAASSTPYLITCVSCSN